MFSLSGGAGISLLHQISWISLVWAFTYWNTLFYYKWLSFIPLTVLFWVVVELRLLCASYDHILSWTKIQALLSPCPHLHSLTARSPEEPLRSGQCSNREDLPHGFSLLHGKIPSCFSLSLCDGVSNAEILVAGAFNSISIQQLWDQSPNSLWFILNFYLCSFYNVLINSPPFFLLPVLISQKPVDLWSVGVIVELFCLKTFNFFISLFVYIFISLSVCIHICICMYYMCIHVTYINIYNTSYCFSYFPKLSPNCSLFNSWFS